MLTLFSMGVFKTLRNYVVTSVFLKIEGQNLVAWGILMCLLQKWH